MWLTCGGARVSQWPAFQPLAPPSPAWGSRISGAIDAFWAAFNLRDSTLAPCQTATALPSKAPKVRPPCQRPLKAPSPVPEREGGQNKHGLFSLSASPQTPLFLRCSDLFPHPLNNPTSPLDPFATIFTSAKGQFLNKILTPSTPSSNTTKGNCRKDVCRLPPRGQCDQQPRQVHRQVRI